jgi:hypothetical protein
MTFVLKPSDLIVMFTCLLVIGVALIMVLKRRKRPGAAQGTCDDRIAQ